MSNGKGDRPRPVNKKRFDAGWDRVFGKGRKGKLRVGKPAKNKTGTGWHTCPYCGTDVDEIIHIDWPGRADYICSNCLKGWPVK